MFEIGDYVEFKFNNKPIIGYILGFQNGGSSILIQITKGGTFGHDGTGIPIYEKDRKTRLTLPKGSNRYWVGEDKLTLRESKNFYEIY
jgi:succinyl-CoA synthetase alpha subunit